MYQVSSPYRRKNIGPLTAYGRFRSNNRSARRYNRGWRRPGAWGAIATYRGRIPRGPRSSYGMITNVVKTIIGPTITYPGTSSTAVFAGHSHSLADLADVASYTAIFDQYRIVGVSVKLIQRQNVVVSAGSSTVQNNARYAFIATDLDDDTDPSSMATLQGYANCKTWDMLSCPSFKFFYRPATSAAAWTGALFAGYTQTRTGYQGPWCDQNNTSIQYYGWKIGVQSQSGVTEGEYLIDVIYKYYVQFKGQR